MTNQFRKLLNALGYSVFGNENTLIECEYDSIYEIAVKQGVFPLVYAAISEENPNQRWEILFLRTIAVNEKKMYCLKAVLDNFEKEGIECCVLKGISVANLYHIPECRLSGDIDIYINPQDEKKTMKLLSGMGMEVMSRKKDSHHFEARDKNGGIIEVHVSLYNKMLGDIVLDNKFTVSEPFIKAETKNGFSVNSLGKEDNLNFLTAHLIKHFVKEGCGIRQVADLLAYINFYKDEIDFDKYFSLLHEIKFEVFIKNVLGIGVKYFGLQFNEYETDLSDKILEDIENGGNFGFGEDERRGFYEKFLRIRSGEDAETFGSKLSKKRRESILKAVFLPDKAFLIKKGYKYLKKTALLYPAAYVHRIFDVLKLLIRRKRKITDLKYEEKTNVTIESRMNLMKEMKII